MKYTVVQSLLISISFLIAIHSNVMAQNKSDDIIGEWATKTKGGHVLIYKQDGKYYGRLKLAIDENAMDTLNSDHKLRSRKINGIIMLNGLVFDGQNSWDNGTIYDPIKGKSYSCKLSLNSSAVLKVRGYIGVSLFGRTDIWTKLREK